MKHKQIIEKEIDKRKEVGEEIIEWFSYENEAFNADNREFVVCTGESEPEVE